MEWNIFKRNTSDIKNFVDEPSQPSATSIFFGKTMLGKSTSLSTFFAAKELITNSLAQLPIIIKKNNKVNHNHPLNFLFDGTIMTKFAFIKMMIDDMLMFGDAYAYIVRAADGTPTSLVYCEHGSVNHFYNQRKQEHYYTASFVKRGKIEPINMIHLYKNSRNGVEGVSLITYAQNILKLAQATDKAVSKYYSGGCALQGALTIKGTRRGSKEAARQAFQETHGDNGSGLVILDDDMSYTPISSNANDSQMLEARLFNVSEIARYFNLNPVLLGDLSHSSYSTIEAANIEFVTHTLMPYVALLEDEFNRKLVKPSERGRIAIDFDETYLLKGDKNATANYYKTMVSSGIMSINEARKQLGLSEVEGYDDLIIPYTKVEDNTVNKDNADGESKRDDKQVIQ